MYPQERLNTPATDLLFSFDVFINQDFLQKYLMLNKQYFNFPNTMLNLNITEQMETRSTAKALFLCRDGG